MIKKKILIGVIVVLSLFDLTCFVLATNNKMKTNVAEKQDNSNVQESTINELSNENAILEKKLKEIQKAEINTNTVNNDVQENTEKQKTPEVKKETVSKNQTNSNVQKKPAESKKPETKKENTNKVQKQTKPKTETKKPESKQTTTQTQTKQEKNTEEKSKVDNKTTTEKAKDEEKYVRNDAMINKIREVIKNNESEYMKEYGYTIVVDSSIKEKTNQFTFTETRVKGYITYKFGTIKIYAEDYYRNGQLIMTECYIF